MIRVTRRKKWRVGAVAAKDNTELAPQFRLPRTGPSNQVFLTAALGMLEKASAQKDLLVPFQLFRTSHRIQGQLPRSVGATKAESKSGLPMFGETFPQ